MEVGGWWLSPASGVSCGKPQTKLGPCVVCACLLLCVCICVCVCDFTFGRLFGRGSSVIAFLAIHVSLHLPSLHPPLVNHGRWCKGMSHDCNTFDTISL